MKRLFKGKKYKWNIKDLKRLSIDENATKYKCHKTTVYYALRRLNIRKGKYVFSESHKSLIKQNHHNISGQNNPNYKNGKTMGKHYCIDCKKEVRYSSTRCCSCHNKHKSIKLHQDDNFLRRSLVGFFKRAKCTGKSKIFYSFLNYLYPNKFKYVGDGTLIIERYTPDFWDGKNILIEFFGSYWHKNEKGIKRDKRKLKKYKNNGYKCLVVWEKELEDLKKLKLKIDRFLLKSKIKI